MEMNIPEAFAGLSLANTERCVFTHVLHVLGCKLKSDCNCTIHCDDDDDDGVFNIILGHLKKTDRMVNGKMRSMAGWLTRLYQECSACR